MFTHQCFCVLLFDCISLVFTGLVSRLIPVLPTHLPAALFVPGPVYLLCCQRGPFSGNPAHKRFHSYASSGRRPLLGVGDLFLCCCSLNPKARGLLQSCPAGMQNVTLKVSHSWETHGCARTKAHFF